MPQSGPSRSRKGCGFFVVLVVLVALAAWIWRAELGFKVFTRIAEDRAGRNALAELDPNALNVGFCGTGSPLPDRDRGEACTVVIAGGRLFIFDTGEGAAKTLTLMGMPLGKVEGVWLTHLHSDHFQGLGNVALQRWAGTSATVPLAVFGPEGVAEVTQGLNMAYRIDSTYRIAHHGVKAVPPSGFGMAGTAIAPGVVYDKDGVRITAFAVHHDPVKPAFGYRLDWKGRSVTLSGDTAASPSLVAAAKGSDILVHEMINTRMVKVIQDASARDGRPGRAKIMADIPSYHTPPEVAAEEAKAAGVHLLAFAHVIPSVPWPLEATLVGDAPKRFDGPIWVMHDGDVISVGADGKAKRSNLIR